MKKTSKLLTGLALLVSLTALSGVLIAKTGNVAAAALRQTTYANGVIDIILGDPVTISGEGATVDGSTVRITAAGVYSISRTMADGRIDVDAEGKVYLEFAGVDDAALFTNDTLIINGSGTLVVTGNNSEGTASDDDIIINSGTVKVTAVDDGLNAHDGITITGGFVDATYQVYLSSSSAAISVTAASSSTAGQL